MQHHEFTRSAEEEKPRSSDRAFGLFFAAVFALIAGYLIWHDNGYLGLASVGVAIVLAVLALSFPKVLAPANRLWMLVGLLLNRIIQPIVMALLYFGTVVPTGLIMRLTGKDPLRLKLDPAAGSYWIERNPPGPSADTVRDQF